MLHMKKIFSRLLKAKLVIFGLALSICVTLFVFFSYSNIVKAEDVDIGETAYKTYNSENGYTTSKYYTFDDCQTATGTDTKDHATYTWSGGGKDSDFFSLGAGQTFTLTASNISNPNLIVYSRIMLRKTYSGDHSISLSISFGNINKTASGTANKTDTLFWFPELKGGTGNTITWTLTNNSSTAMKLSGGYMDIVYVSPCTVNFNKTGGTGGTDSTTTYYWFSYSNISAPTKSGYKFLGYYDAETGGNKIYNANGSPAQNSWSLKPSYSSKPVELYAQWEVAEQVVKVAAGTGINSVYLSTNQNATSGSASGTKFNSGSTVYAFAKLAKGYKHKSGWTRVSGTEDTEGAIYRVSSKSVGTSTVDFGTISADLITYTIEYTLNGGSVSGNPTTYNVTSDKITLKNPTRTGYTFNGWTGSNGTTAQTSVSIAKGSIGNKSYTANWTVDTYTIAFNKNAEDAIGETASVTATYDSTRSLTSNGFSRVGYDFAGWATSSTGEVAFADNATLTKEQVNTLYTTAKKGGTYTLYAKWKYVEEIQAVVDKINAIGTVEYTNACKTKIETAEAAYDALSGTYKNIIVIINKSKSRL